MESQVNGKKEKNKRERKKERRERKENETEKEKSKVLRWVEHSASSEDKFSLQSLLCKTLRSFASQAL